MKGWRTLALAALTGFGPMLSQLASIDPAQTFGVSPGAGLAIGVGFAFLRAITTTPMFQSN